MKKEETNRMHNKIENRTRQLVVGFASALSGFVLAVLVIQGLKKQSPAPMAIDQFSVSAINVEGAESQPDPPSQPSFQIRVSGDPSMGQQQFSPPTNSVVVTNEAQLRMLIEQARAAQRQDVQQ